MCQQGPRTTRRQEIEKPIRQHWLHSFTTLISRGGNVKLALTLIEFGAKKVEFQRSYLTVKQDNALQFTQRLCETAVRFVGVSRAWFTLRGVRLNRSD